MIRTAKTSPGHIFISLTKSASLGLKAQTTKSAGGAGVDKSVFLYLQCAETDLCFFNVLSMFGSRLNKARDIGQREIFALF